MRTKSERRCFKCLEEKLLLEFPRDRSRNKKGLGRSYLCKICTNKKSEKRRRMLGIRTREQYLSDMGFSDENKKVTSKKRWLVLVRDKFTCQFCGRSAPNVELEIDHIIPKSKGGKARLDNLQVSCVQCNRSKQDMLLS